MYAFRTVAMLAANFFTVIVLVFWAGLLWMGSGLVRGVADRHISGYPNAFQVIYGIGIPATLIILLCLALIIFNFVKRSPVILVTVVCASILVFFFELIAIDGGM